jgi:endoglucanase
VVLDCCFSGGAGAKVLHAPCLTSAGRVFASASASGGRALAMWSNGSASGSLVTPAATEIKIVARGDQWNGSPKLTLTVDGKQLLATGVTSTTWTTYTVRGTWNAGTHSVKTSFSNDAWGGAVSFDRNLYIDAVTFGGGSSAPRTLNLYDPWATVDDYVAQYPELKKIADTPQAVWLGEWIDDPYAEVRAHMTAAAGRTVPLVVYNIPNRDNGGYSAGGLATAAEYLAWVRAIAAGVGTGKAIIVLEPDALGHSVEFDSPGERAATRQLLASAVDILTQQPNAKVYIDASMWVPTDVMAALLIEAGVDKADGFSINVSAFNTLETSYAFGNAVSSKLIGKHYVVDSSRNGRGPLGDEWCNPAGRGLGVPPQIPAGQPLVDALLWIKHPGESDGTCNGGPRAGDFWVDYARGLVARADA